MTQKTYQGDFFSLYQGILRHKVLSTQKSTSYNYNTITSTILHFCLKVDISIHHSIHSKAHTGCHTFYKTETIKKKKTFSSSFFHFNLTSEGVEGFNQKTYAGLKAFVSVTRRENWLHAAARPLQPEWTNIEQRQTRSADSLWDGEGRGGLAALMRSPSTPLNQHLMLFLNQQQQISNMSSLLTMYTNIFGYLVNFFNSFKNRKGTIPPPPTKQIKERANTETDTQSKWTKILANDKGNMLNIEQFMPSHSTVAILELISLTALCNSDPWEIPYIAEVTEVEVCCRPFKELW